MSSPTTFNNAKLENEFNQQGFVRFNVLNGREVEMLLNEYNQLPRPKDSGFHCTMFSPNSKIRERADLALKNSISHKLNSVFCEHQALYGNFMVKESGVESDWFVHQDWSYVDETQNVSVAVWIPLVDLTEENGVICVVPGSHKIENHVRGPGVNDPWQNLHESIKRKYHKKIYLKAGEAIIWHHRLVHFSPANMSEEPRVAGTLIYTPKNASVVHFWKDPILNRSLVNSYLVDSSFFMSYDIINEPSGVARGEQAESDFPTINQDQLLSVFKTN